MYEYMYICMYECKWVSKYLWVVVVAIIRKSTDKKKEYVRDKL